MPTPMRAYAEAARLFGNADPANPQEVEAFFVQTLPRFSPARQEEVLAFLLSLEGAPTTSIKKSLPQYKRRFSIQDDPPCNGMHSIDTPPLLRCTRCFVPLPLLPPMRDERDDELTADEDFQIPCHS